MKKTAGKKNLSFGKFAVRKRFSDWLRSALSDQLFWLFFLTWLGSLIIALGYTVFRFNNLPLEIPLFYSRPWGEGQLAKNTYIFLPIAGTFLLGIFDFGLAINFHTKDRVFAYLLGGTAALLAILSLVTTVNIVRLVG